mmetsp:Transcript_22433/g.69446  ORF Transcript_22433/g.69446 Transcript_22433/m.69446 type:complete len:379 (-) Transcript_22433:1192-2328(-)
MRFTRGPGERDGRALVARRPPCGRSQAPCRITKNEPRPRSAAWRPYALLFNSPLNNPPPPRRGRPEMMTGIKRIACKGELSLNRLRNDDVPYDPSVPSEETLEPEQDVNSLKKAARKRKRGWRDDRGVTKKGGESPPISPSGTRSGAVKEELRKLLRLHTEPLHPVSCDANDGLVTRPPPAASVDLKDLPTRSTDYMLKASALSRLNSMYPKFTLPEPSGDGSRRFLESGATTPPDFIGISSDSSPNVANVVSEGGDSVLPKRLNIALPKQYVLKKEKQQMEHLKSRDGPVVLPTHLNLPPPCSNLTKNEVEELLPVPLAPMNPPSSIPSNLSFSKRFGSNTSLLSLSGPIKRSVSEASDMWRIDDIDSELDFNGLFD